MKDNFFFAFTLNNWLSISFVLVPGWVSKPHQSGGKADEGKIAPVRNPCLSSQMQTLLFQGKKNDGSFDRNKWVCVYVHAWKKRRGFVCAQSLQITYSTHHVNVLKKKSLRPVDIWTGGFYRVLFFDEIALLAVAFHGGLSYGFAILQSISFII